MNENKTQLQRSEGSPKFGRLLIVLFSAVALIVLITVLSEAYYTP